MLRAIIKYIKLGTAPDPGQNLPNTADFVSNLTVDPPPGPPGGGGAKNEIKNRLKHSQYWCWPKYGAEETRRG